MIIFLASNQQIADPGTTHQLGPGQVASARAAPKHRVCWFNQFCEYVKQQFYVRSENHQQRLEQ